MDKDVIKLLQDKELFTAVAEVTSPLGQELLIKGADAHSPIGIDDLDKFECGLRDEALSQLYSFEKEGLFTSELKEDNGRLKREFTITPDGRKLVYKA